MKLYIGIRQANPHLPACALHADRYLVALDSQGAAVFKTCFPSDCPPEAVTNSLKALQPACLPRHRQAFSASLRIATCLEESSQPLIDAIKKEFSSVKSFSPSVLYSTDLIPEDPFASPEPYRYPILLAILDSLSG